MKTHSIQFKFLSTVISAMLAVTIFIGGLSIFEVSYFVQRQTENYINVTCEKETTQVNDIFGDMEKSVNIMESYILDFFSDASELEDRDKQNEMIENAEDMFLDVVKNTGGVVAYYIRLAPELSDHSTGFFYTKSSDSEEYIRFETTDLSLYDKDDTEHVGWYWQPYEVGRPLWMKPYYNKNNGIMMISYVVPLYFEKQFIGVVGMDFDYTVLTDKVQDIKIYENGFAHLEMDDTAIYYNGAVSLSHASGEYLQVSGELVNGMTLVLSASYEDIRQIQYEISLRILVGVLVLASVFSLVTVVVVARIVKPLKKLTAASQELAAGNYDLEPIHSDTYEIHLLSTAFENMAKNLREHQKQQYILAYRDSLTGFRNTTSYKAWITEFNKEIQRQDMDFGVMVFDVNYLKETNDQYGHVVGNKLIIAVSRLIGGTFKRSPVFRIGGDEFVAILQNKDLREYETLCARFDLECENSYVEEGAKNIPISIARGFARYDSGTDAEFVDVFKRADREMYRNKREMKSAQALKCFFRQGNAAYLHNNR